MSSRGINKVILIGNVGQNPEMRYIPNGIPVTNITIATSANWKDKQTGENKENTEWHRVVLYGKIAEIAKEYLRKGSQVYIEGYLHTRKWQDQNNIDRYTTEIIVNNLSGGVMQMLGNKQNNSNITTSPHESNDIIWNQSQQVNKYPASNQKKEVNLQNDSQLNKNNIDFDDDIPF